MTVVGKPTISVDRKKKSFTSITFKPDLSRFGLIVMDDDTLAVMRRRVYDVAGNIGKTTHVYLNGEKLPVKGFSDYVNLYLGGDESTFRAFERSHDGRWQVCVAVGDGNHFQQCSFVNGICTSKGGTHVTLVVDGIASKLLERIKRKEKSCKNLNVSHVKKHMWIFVNALGNF